MRAQRVQVYVAVCVCVSLHEFIFLAPWDRRRLFTLDIAHTLAAVEILDPHKFNLSTYKKYKNGFLGVDRERSVAWIAVS